MDIGPGYDLAATEKCWNRGQIVQRTHNWSQRSWVINRANSVATRSMVKFKTSNLRFQIVSGRRPMSYVIAPPVVEYRGRPSRTIGRMHLVVPSGDLLCHPSCNITFGSAITRDLSRLVARLCNWWYDQLCDGSQMPRMGVRSVAGPDDLSYDRSQDAIIDHVIGRRITRLIVRAVAGRHD